MTAEMAISKTGVYRHEDEPTEVGKKFMSLVREWRKNHPNWTTVPDMVQDRLWAEAGLVISEIGIPAHEHQNDSPSKAVRE
ncbi:MAG TPA: hypothetical protein VLH19_00020 [Patescibacteria group bacterium]|nr:hypothetical protein [Patescibacteria group bacterium]